MPRSSSKSLSSQKSLSNKDAKKEKRKKKELKEYYKDLYGNRASIKERLAKKIKKDTNRLSWYIVESMERIKETQNLLSVLIEKNVKELKEIARQEMSNPNYWANHEFGYPLSQLRKIQVLKLLTDHLNNDIQSYESSIKETKKEIENISDPENQKILQKIFEMEQRLFEDFDKNLRPTLNFEKMAEDRYRSAPFDYDTFYVEFLHSFNTFNIFYMDDKEKPPDNLNTFNEKQAKQIFDALKPYEGQVVYVHGGSGGLGQWGDYEPIYIDNIRLEKIPKENRIDPEFEEWKVVFNEYKLDVGYRGVGMFSTVYTAKPVPSFLKYLDTRTLIKLKKRESNYGFYHRIVVPEVNIYSTDPEEKIKFRSLYQKMGGIFELAGFNRSINEYRERLVEEKVSEKMMEVGKESEKWEDEKDYIRSSIREKVEEDNKKDVEILKNDFKNIRGAILTDKSTGIIFDEYEFPKTFRYSMINPSSTINEVFQEHFKKAKEGKKIYYVNFNTGKGFNVSLDEVTGNLIMEEVKE